ncbi:elongator complex protein 5 [Anastrepha ludens]|uniref:elongator complex protein 5 n=1 Tax=Anastrepha ludens TaxID=28586 RepID=UPI0023AFE35B|nr:elongator complex protein 5 [Anastrepha ludens]
MLSNLIITKQHFVVIIDETGLEKISHRILYQFLGEQEKNEKLVVKTLPLSSELKDWTTFTNFAKKCSKEEKCNVLLPSLSDLICYQSVAKIIKFVHKLRICEKVQRLFLWITPANLTYPRAEYLISAFEYMADLYVHLETSNILTIITRKPGGGVTNKRYTYTKTKKEFLVEPVQNLDVQAKASPPKTSPAGGTFKIELNEDEMVARNTLKMPYEKTSETEESSIIYTPDAADDYDDEEDPDEDLCI